MGLTWLDNKIANIMEKRRKGKKTELEIEVQKCSHMILDLERIKKPLMHYGDRGYSKITTGPIIKSENDVICEFTGEPCSLYEPGYSINSQPYMRDDHLKRCPTFEVSVERYKLKGIKRGDLFDNVKIKRIEE